MPSVLGYWTVRGIGQAARYLLEYAGEDYTEKTYTLPDDPNLWEEYVKSGGWGIDKANFIKQGELFANLPYYKDENTQQTLYQSGAILRYLGRKHHLYAATENEHQRQDFLFEQLADFRAAMIKVEYYKGPLEAYLDENRKHLKGLSGLLGDDPWFTGNKITCVDFFLYEYLVWFRDIPDFRLPDEFWNDVPNLQAYCKRFEDLPAIKSYMASDRFIKWPFFYGDHGGPHAKRTL